MKRLVLCVLLVGCAGDDSGGGSIAIDDFGMDLSAASCAKQFDCCTDMELMDQYMGITYNGHAITTEADCTEFANALISGLAVTQWKESLAMGRVDYDGSAAGGCLAAINNVTCGSYSMSLGGNLAVPCSPYLIPKVAEGGACTQDYECTTHNCVGETTSSEGPDTDGACQPLPAAGQACNDNCPDGHYCGYDTTNGNKICLALEADGTQCILDSECASDYCDNATDVCAMEPATCDGR